MPVSGARLGGALNPLPSHTLKQWSLASSAGPDFFPDFLLASCGALAPFRLCSHHQPQSSPWDPTEARASAPSPRPPRRVSRQASWAGECWSAPILCAGISPLCPLHPFFLLPFPGTWGFSCLLGSLRSSAALSRCSVGAVPQVNVFLMYLWGGR